MSAMQMLEFVSKYLGTTEDHYTRFFRLKDVLYHEPKLVLYRTDTDRSG